MKIIKERILVQDMHCTSCEKIIEKNLKNLPGVSSVIARYSDECVMIEYDESKLTLKEIKNSINSSGYTVGIKKSSLDSKNIVGILTVVTIILILGKYSGTYNIDSALSGKVSFLILFTVGILTSLHCIGMCGGIMLSQTITIGSTPKTSSIKPSLFYNLGRVISYTILGGMVGIIGSAFSISIYTKSLIMIFAGFFMIMMGFNMAGFSLFKKISIKLPWSTCKIKQKTKSPFFIGLLNGFMPCGPLQTMQLYALGTGSFIGGAISMFAFSLGTVPLMLSFGALTGFLSKDYTKKILKLSGFMILFLGVIMTNRGLALSGFNIKTLIPDTNYNSTDTDNTEENTTNFAKATIKDGYQEVKISALARGYTPSVLYVQKNIPVKMIVDGEQLTSCNNAIVIPSFNIQKKLTSGENLIEFIPSDKDINFSCWMGMISGVIKVTDNLDLITAESAAADVEEVPYESIYGPDLSILPAEVLVKIALVENKKQSIEILGVQLELNPLIVVAEKGKELQIKFDFEEYQGDSPEIHIYDLESQQIITTIPISSKNFVADFKFDAANGYAILLNSNIAGIIEIVEDINNVDLESTRNKYIPSN